MFHQFKNILVIKLSNIIFFSLFFLKKFLFILRLLTKSLEYHMNSLKLQLLKNPLLILSCTKTIRISLENPLNNKNKHQHTQNIQ